MLTALCGTPGTGKTTAAGLLRADGWTVVTITELIEGLGAHDGRDPVTGELLVDTDELAVALNGWARTVSGDVLVEGHLAYLVPASLVLLFRVDPDIVMERLLVRGYSGEKARENAEAEAVSCVLFDCMARERLALAGRDWSELPEGCPVVLEADTTAMNPHEQAGWVREMVLAYEEKRLKDMRPFRPPVVDWMEVVSGWY